MIIRRKGRTIRSGMAKSRTLEESHWEDCRVGLLEIRSLGGSLGTGPLEGRSLGRSPVTLWQ